MRKARTLAEAIEHRARREEQLLAQLGAEPRRIADLVAELYKGLPQGLMRMVQANLLSAATSWAGLWSATKNGGAFSTRK